MSRRSQRLLGSGLSSPSPMDSNPPSWALRLLDEFAQLRSSVDELKSTSSSLARRVDTLEQSRKESERPGNPADNRARQAVQDDISYREVRVDAPHFTGTRDAKIYLSWEADMESYFAWYEMPESRKVKFAEMKLTGDAKTYWTNVGKLLSRCGEESIQTWGQMKEKLREKYLPPNYHLKLLSQWRRFTQGTLSGAEYVQQFDQFLLACDVDEDPKVTLSRFMSGLREDLHQQPLLKDISALEEAYQFVEECDKLPGSSPSNHEINREPTSAKVSAIESLVHSPCGPLNSSGNSLPVSQDAAKIIATGESAVAQTPSRAATVAPPRSQTRSLSRKTDRKPETISKTARLRKRRQESGFVYF